MIPYYVFPATRFDRRAGAAARQEATMNEAALLEKLRLGPDVDGVVINTPGKLAPVFKSAGHTAVAAVAIDDDGSALRFRLADKVKRR